MCGHLLHTITCLLKGATTCGTAWEQCLLVKDVYAGRLGICHFLRWRGTGN